MIGNGTLWHQKWYDLNKKVSLKDKSNLNTALQVTPCRSGKQFTETVE